MGTLQRLLRNVSLDTDTKPHWWQVRQRKPSSPKQTDLRWVCSDVCHLFNATNVVCVCACVGYVCYIRTPAAGWICESLLRPFNPEAPGDTNPSRGPVPERADWVVVTIRPAWTVRGERFYGNKMSPHTHTDPHTRPHTHVCTNTHKRTKHTKHLFCKRLTRRKVKQSKGLWAATLQGAALITWYQSSSSYDNNCSLLLRELQILTIYTLDKKLGLSKSLRLNQLLTKKIVNSHW